MTVPTIGTPEEFERDMQAREANPMRKRALLRRVAALTAEQQAAFIAQCAALGAAYTDEHGYDDARSMLSRAILAANAGTDREDDAAYRARAAMVLDNLEAFAASLEG